MCLFVWDLMDRRYQTQMISKETKTERKLVGEAASMTCRSLAKVRRGVDDDILHFTFEVFEPRARVQQWFAAMPLKQKKKVCSKPVMQNRKQESCWKGLNFILHEKINQGYDQLISRLLCRLISELDMTGTYTRIAVSNMSREDGGHLRGYCCAVHLLCIQIDTYSPSAR